MAGSMSPEEMLKKIDDAIARKKAIADGELVAPFTTADNMQIYDFVYKLVHQKRSKPDCVGQLYEKYKNFLEERIMEKAIPSLLGKHGASLLKEVANSWSEFKAFSNSIFKFFFHLDRFHTSRKGIPAVGDLAEHCFSKLVCERLYGEIQETAIKLVNQDREGKEIDRNLLKSVFKLFLDLGEKGTTNYYAKFENIMLAETSVYYSELSMEWWFWRDSYANYLRKVDWCLVQEEARSDIYPYKSTKEKVLMRNIRFKNDTRALCGRAAHNDVLYSLDNDDPRVVMVMKYIMLERNAKRWNQKQKTDGVRVEDEELVRKYTSLSLTGDFSTSE